MEQASPEQISEGDLVLRAKARNEWAWATIYDRHREAIYRYAFARLRNREDAEDLVGQVFLEALRGIDRFEYRGAPLLAWLYGIAANQTKKRLRAGRRAAISIEAGRTIELELADSSAPFDLLETLDLIEHLTEAQREVIILRFLVSLPIREVAEVMGRPETAVISLQARALASLRKSLVTQAPYGRERSVA